MDLNDSDLARALSGDANRMSRLEKEQLFEQVWAEVTPRRPRRRWLMMAAPLTVAAAAPQVTEFFTAVESEPPPVTLDDLAIRSLVFDVNGNQMALFSAENRDPVTHGNCLHCIGCAPKCRYSFLDDMLADLAAQLVT